MEYRYLTAHQVAELLQLNVESIYDMAGDGRIPASKICGRWRFEAGEVNEWFRSVRAPADGEAGDR